MQESYGEIHWDNFRIVIERGVREGFDREGLEDHWLTPQIVGNASVEERTGAGFLRMRATGPFAGAGLYLNRSYGNESFVAQAKLRIGSAAGGGKATLIIGGLVLNETGEPLVFSCRAEGVDALCSPTLTPEVRPPTHFARIPLVRDATLVVTYRRLAGEVALRIPEVGWSDGGIPVTWRSPLGFGLSVQAQAWGSSIDVEWDEFMVSMGTGLGGTFPEMALEDRLYTHEDGAFFLKDSGDLLPVTEVGELPGGGSEPVHAALVSVARDPLEGEEDVRTIYTFLDLENLKTALFQRGERAIIECFSEAVFTPEGEGRPYRWSPAPCNRRPAKRPDPLPDAVDAEDEGCLPDLCP